MEKCRCGHSEKSHLIEPHRTICCAMWRSRKTEDIVGCECQEFKLKDKGE